MMWSDWIAVWGGARMLPTLIWLTAAAFFASFIVSRRLSWLAQFLWWPLQLATLFCVLLMVFPPSIPGEPDNSVLLTTGGDLERVQADRLMPGLLDSEQRIRQQGGALPEDVTLAGHGLTPQQWYEQTRPQSVRHNASAPDGYLMDFDLPAEVIAGRAYPARVTLVPNTDNVRVDLVDAKGEPVATLESDDNGALTLPALPTGRRTLNLIVSRDGVELERAAIGVNAIQPELARILLVQDAPGFEGRYFLSWAGAAGASVAVRTQVSEARFLTRFVNRDAVDLDRLDRSLLESIDLVAISGAAFGALSSDERERLLDAESDSGVLVMIHDADDLKAVGSMSGVIIRDNPSEVIYQVDASVAHVESGLSRLNVRFDDTIWIPVLTDLAGDALIVVRRDNPSFALSLIRDSFRVHGAGGAEAYAELWSPVIERLARPADTSQLMVSPERPRVYERLRVCAQPEGSVSTLRIVAPDGSSSEQRLFESALRLGQQCTWFWPDQIGWHRFESDSLSTERYVASSQSWSGSHSRAALSITEAVAQISGSGEGVQQAPRQVQREKILPWLLSLWLLSWFVQRIALAPRSTSV
ncbi:MAG: hypothetical protein AAF578_15505 [Pseudomonadota bacterium]